MRMNKSLTLLKNSTKGVFEELRLKGAFEELRKASLKTPPRASLKNSVLKAPLKTPPRASLKNSVLRASLKNSGVFGELRLKGAFEDSAKGVFEELRLKGVLKNSVLRAPLKNSAKGVFEELRLKGWRRRSKLKAVSHFYNNGTATYHTDEQLSPFGKAKSLTLLKNSLLQQWRAAIRLLTSRG
ncbi:6224_t:CDS:2 [Paraglomus brasilianum]|uniref:6224_t:CDS:1 n=1 Tax=Paraglomus brasilianum TaxID=144538 RepID=A0A9N9ALE4_9GLOM|nr:6224_t:CDS:2 [Paraglomus brasilianum]